LSFLEHNRFHKLFSDHFPMFIGVGVVVCMSQAMLANAHEKLVDVKAEDEDEEQVAIENTMEEELQAELGREAAKLEQADLDMQAALLQQAELDEAAEQEMQAKAELELQAELVKAEAQEENAKRRKMLEVVPPPPPATSTLSSSSSKTPPVPPPPPPPGWKPHLGDRWRQGCMGGRQRWGNSGGGSREYYHGYYVAKGRGKDCCVKEHSPCKHEVARRCWLEHVANVDVL